MSQFGGYESAQAVLDAVAAGAIVKRELVDLARAVAQQRDIAQAQTILERLGRDFAINFDSPAARATLKGDEP